MRALCSSIVGIAMLASSGCSRSTKQVTVYMREVSENPSPTHSVAIPDIIHKQFAGLDRNEYPGDTTMLAMQRAVDKNDIETLRSIYGLKY